MKFIKDIIHALFAMSGILLDKISFIRIIQIIVIAGSFLIYRLLIGQADIRLAIIYFVLVWASRYMFLFTSFIKNGIADQLKSRFGEERGFEIYQFITALMFFHGALSFSLLVSKSSLADLTLFRQHQEIFLSLGVIISAVGFLVNVWCTLIIGVDIYYYKDLFMGRPVTEFKKEGPYRFISNPMYALGQAGGYGTALMFASFAGLAGILLNQILMYIFYYTVEKPHVIKFFGQS